MLSQVVTLDPRTDLWSMKCPNHPQGGEHEEAYIHEIHSFKLAGPKLYDRIKNWGVEQVRPTTLAPTQS